MPPNYDKGRQIEEPAHIAELTARKREARRHRGMDRLAHAAPASTELLKSKHTTAITAFSAVSPPDRNSEINDNLF